MAIDRTPVLKRCRQLGIDPVVLGYTTKESKREPKRRRKESEYGMLQARTAPGRRYG